MARARFALLFAASISAAGCFQAEGQTGSTGGGAGCQMSHGACKANSDCCSGFSCVAELCVFEAASQADGGSSGGSSSSGGSGGTSGSSGSSGGTTSGGGTSGGFTPAPHPPFPQLLQQGGPVLANPVVVPLVFAGDPLAPQLQEFATALGSSTYWTSALAEYGVGAATAEVPSSPAPAPTTTTMGDADVRNAVSQYVQQAGTGFQSAGKVVVVFMPPGVTYSDATLFGTSADPCSMYAGGYHSFMVLPDGSNLPYAVILRCSSVPNGSIGQASGTSISGIDAATSFASHEIAEAATDPFAQDVNSSDNAAPNPGWFLTSDLSLMALSETEVADLCENTSTPFYRPAGFPFMVQHLWSNQVAKAGVQDPCGELEGSPPFFDSVPVLSTIQIQANGQTVSNPGLSIPVGSSQTVELDLFSDGPTQNWQVQALDLTSMLDPNRAQYLSFSLDRSSGGNGDKLHLTVTVQQAGTFHGISNVEVLLITSTQGGFANLWPVFVQN